MGQANVVGPTSIEGSFFLAQSSENVENRHRILFSLAVFKLPHLRRPTSNVNEMHYAMVIFS